MRQTVKTSALVAALSLVLVACGTGADQSANTTRDVTTAVTTRVTTASAAPTTTRPQVPVPDVTGLTLDEAKTAVEASGLVISTAYLREDEPLSAAPTEAEWPNWTVTSQLPVGGSTLGVGLLVRTTAAATSELGFTAALVQAGLSVTYSLANGNEVCDSLRAGGRPPEPDIGFRGQLPAEFLVDVYGVGTGGDDEKLADAATSQLCPAQRYAYDNAISGKYPTAPPLDSFTDGNHVVGQDIAPGTYRTGRVSDCYWARLRADGSIIDNNFASAALEIAVTVRDSDAIFETQGCGTWKKSG